MKKRNIVIISVALAAVIALSLILFLPKGKGGNKNLLKDEKGTYYLDDSGSKVYKLVMMDHGVPATSNQFKYRQQVMDKMNEKLLQDLGYKVDIQIDVYSDDTFADKLAFALADGEQLDLVRQASKELLTSYVSQGIAKDISAYTSVAENMQANIPDEMWAEAQYADGTYAIPLDKLAVNTTAFIRGDLLEKAGYTELTTIADWEGFMKKVKEGGEEYLDSRLDTVPLMGAFTTYEEMFYGNFTETPGNFFNSEGKIRPKYFDAGYKQFILKMREWLKNEYIDSSMFNFNEFAMKEYMTNEITGAIAAGIYHLEFGSLLNVNTAHPEWKLTPAMPVAFCNALALAAEENPALDLPRLELLAPAAISS